MMDKPLSQIRNFTFLLIGSAVINQSRVFNIAAYQVADITELMFSDQI